MMFEEHGDYLKYLVYKQTVLLFCFKEKWELDTEIAKDFGKRKILPHMWDWNAQRA